MKRHILAVVLLFTATLAIAQNFTLPCVDANYRDGVKSIQLYPVGEPLQQPLITLDNAMEALSLSFDVLGSNAEVLNYTFLHCTHDWQLSDIQRILYVNGYDYDQIDNYDFSVNTLVDYVNYSLSFPNYDMMPLVSGNYLLVVFGDDMSEENVYFTRRFMVLQEKGSIGATIPKYAKDVSLSDTHHQLDIKASLHNIMGANAMQYTNVTIRQNGRWDNAVMGLKPSYVYPNYLSYDNNPLTVFEAANQYRRFSISNFHYQSEGIISITENRNYHVVQLDVDEVLANKPFTFYEDMHGMELVHVTNKNKIADIEADYAVVNFSLEWPYELQNADMYIFGALSDWDFTNENKMWYDAADRCYRGSLFLKQGYYNYLFAIVENGSTRASLAETAGNFWETDNEYHLYLYYYNAIKGYDELIGYSLVSSH